MRRGELSSKELPTTMCRCIYSMGQTSFRPPWPPYRILAPTGHGPELLISRRLLLNTASATSHQVVDSMSWDSFFTTWAAYSRARAMSDPDGHAFGSGNSPPPEYVQPEISAPGMVISNVHAVNMQRGCGEPFRSISSVRASHSAIARCCSYPKLSATAH